MTTAVVGAGPAGLMFSLVSRLLFERMGGDRERWTLRLYDKRETYVRIHRLRMAKEPYLAIQRDVDDRRFDALIAFLEEHHYSPEVNLLEAKLTELLGELGVRKEVLEVTSLDQLREPGTLTVVAADSVHSTIRELVRGDVAPTRYTHERVARVRVVGDELPPRLGVVDQYRLSKVLGSVVDYRLNQNGFAEIDLFLTEEEHEHVRALGASPKDPVEITSRMVARAPLFRAIVANLERDSRKILLQSTFALEHTVMPRVAFEVDGTHVFLLGDAGVSLPFFRGMACLASCAQALAHVHCAMLEDDTEVARSYDRQVAAIVKREVAIVRSRASLVRRLRELARVSAMLPFPIQSWWLSAAREPEPDKISAGTTFNALIALAAAGCAATGYVSPWLAIVSLPLEVAGGIAYRWTLDLEPGPHRHLRRVWEVQIAIVLVGGVIAALTRRAHVVAALWWWILGLAFVGGIYVFEVFIARRLRRAQLGEE